MRQRLAGLGVDGVQVRTFHAAALSQLRYFWPPPSGAAEILPHKAGSWARACASSGCPSRPLLRDVAAEIEWAGRRW